MMYYKDEQTGSYYAKINGELVQYPMNQDGSMSNSPCSVDWDCLWDEENSMGDDNLFFIGKSKRPITLTEYLRYIWAILA